MDTTDSTSRNPIPTPLPLLLRRVRYQVVPVLTLLVCLILSGWLWMRRGGSVTAIGSVNAIQVPVNAKIDGLLVNLPADRKVQVFDQVIAGEVLARLDSSHIEAQIERETERLNEVRRQLEMLDPKVKRRNPTTAPATGAQAAPADATASNTVIKGAAARSALTHAEATESDTSADAEAMNNPLLQNKFTLEMMASSYQTKIQELEQRILAQDIKAPIAGTVIAVHRMPGQAVTAGQAIVTIASEKGDYIVTYVRQSQVLQPTDWMAVNVHLRSAPRTLRSHVMKVGPQLERIPPEHLRDPRVQEWGLPVHIAIPTDPLHPSQPVKLRPGELVDLFFKPKEKFGGSGLALQ